jgi:hypothetical protein
LNDLLPLSWINTAVNRTQEIQIKDNFFWITFAEVYNKQKFLHEFSNSSYNFLIRGCAQEQFNDFKNILPYKFFTGTEALLKTSYPHFKKKSLKELIKRGNKKLDFIEIDFDKDFELKLNSFYSKTRNGNKPQLKYLFRTKPDSSQRIFTAIDKDSNLQGLITLTQNSIYKYHCELLLKNKNAPQGTMEFLLKSIFDKLSQEGIRELSLGEVPFFNINSIRLNFLEKIFIVTGKSINFAYNSKGLYNFKNKFNPFWNDLYMISNKKIDLEDMYHLMRLTNLDSLIKSQLLQIF